MAVHKKHIVLGHGINDYTGSTTENGKRLPFYNAWYNMIKRVYSNEFHKWKPTYKGCSICREWLSLSNFKKWFDNNYIDGWQLDKDLILPSNKIYSPETCCFVPREINMFLTKGSYKNTSLPLGVCWDKERGKFISYISSNHKFKYLGRFESAQDAFLAYKNAKEKIARHLARKYQDCIDERAYRALNKFKVSNDR